MASQKTEWILELQDNMSKKLGMIDSEFDDVKKSHDELNSQLKGTDTEGLNDLKKTVSENDEVLSGARKSATDFYTALQTGDVQGASTAIQGLTSNVKGLMSASWAFIATPIGASLAILAGIGIATKEWAQFNIEAIEANKLVKAITNENDSQLSGLRVMGMALEKTYGGDWVEHLRQINSLQKGFKISSKEAYEEYNSGMLRGGRANDEFRDSIREYPKLFEKYGFAAKDFINIINNSADAGVWSDKMPDAIKEFGLSVTEQTTASREALENAFGAKFTNNLYNNIKDGSITVREALRMVSEESRTTNLNQQQQAQLTADLFRGAGEDASGFNEIIKITNQSLNDQQDPLSAIEQQLSNVAKQNLLLETAQANALESDSYKVFAQELDLTWKQIQLGWYNTLAFVQDSYSDSLKIFKGIFSGIEALVDNFYDLTIGNIIDIKNQFTGLVDSVLSVGSIWDAIKNGDVSGAIDAAKEWGKGVHSQFDDIKNTAKESATEIMGVFAEGTLNGYNKEGARQDQAVLDYNEANPFIQSPEAGKGNAGNGNAGASLDLGGSQNGGNGRVINMNLEIKNIFNVADGKLADLERMADSIIGIVVDKLRDSAIATG
jgi:hypothetical protein